jgi:NitT/TauT family transport system substrate-binding protein
MEVVPMHTGRLIRRAAYFTTSIILTPFTACNRSALSTTETLRISVNSWVGFGPLFVAQREGLFAKHGIHVDIVKMEGSADRRAALISGRIDVLGSTLDDLAVGLSQGVDAIAFACADFSNGGDGILGFGQIDNLTKLAKHPVAVQPGFVNHFFLLYVLDSRGISTDSLRLLPMTPDDAGAAFLAGKIDAAVTWEPFLSQAVNQRPGTHVLIRSDSFPEAILDLFVAKRTWIAEHPHAVEEFKGAWSDGLKFLTEHRDSAMIEIGQEIGVDPKAASDMLRGAQLLDTPDCRAMLTPRLHSLAERVTRLWRKAGYISRDIDLEGSVRIGPP